MTTTVQLTRDNLHEIAHQIGAGLWGTPASPVLVVRTSRGTVHARPGDWITTTPDGQYDVRPGDCPECEAGFDHTEHCPTPETHNWGCGCPTDEAPAAALEERVSDRRSRR